MSICEFFIDRNETSHLEEQQIDYMEGIGDANAEGANGMGKLLLTALLFNRAAAL